MAPRLLTVVLNYKTPEMTLKSVEAALREMEGIAGEIVVVDNDSRDGSDEKLRAGIRAAVEQDEVDAVVTVEVEPAEAAAHHLRHDPPLTCPRSLF